jgi:hypothetical protein
MVFLFRYKKNKNRNRTTMTKALVYIISLALIVQILFSQNLPLIHAIAVEYDFETPADYTISDSSAAYVHGGAAKLL